MKTNTSIKTLYLYGNYDEENGVWQIATVIPELCQIKQYLNALDVTPNIGPDGAKIICEFLKTNTTLTELNLACDWQGYNNFNK